MGDWALKNMDRSKEMEGLFTFDLTLASSGNATFQIALDHDPEFVIYPSARFCTRKATPLLGPGKAPDREHAWVIKGVSGARYSIEVFRRPSTTSVSWYKVSDKVAKSDPQLTETLQPFLVE